MINKSALHQKCIELLETKINDIQELLADAQASSNNDTKSSMGDKYETTREMMQIEIDKLTRQRYDATQMILALKVQNPVKKCETVQEGALVKTDKFWFYIATGLGKVTLKEQIIMVISAESPIGKTMLNKKSGDTAIMNSITYSIQSIS